MNRQQLLYLARQGNPSAIAQLVQSALTHQRIQVEAELQYQCLYLLLESAQPLDQTELSRFLRSGLERLQIPQVRLVNLTAKQVEKSTLDWQCEFWVQSHGAFPSPEPCDSPVDSASVLPQMATPKPRPYAVTTSPVQLSRPSKKQKDLGWMVVERFNWLKFSLILFLTLHSILGSRHYTILGALQGSDALMVFLHNVNLIFHEAGHVFFMFFGRFLHLLGGSLFQIMLPAGLCGYFWFTRQRFASAIALWWVGQNFLDVSIYIRDARERLLPLLGGEGGLHDWHFILLDLRLLTRDDQVANGAFAIGILIYIAAIALGVFFAQRQSEEKPAKLPVD